MRIIAYLLMFTFWGYTATAQFTKVSGYLKDGTDQSPMVGASVILYSVTDTTQRTGGISDATGYFEIDELLPGNYRLRVSYIGYNMLEKFVKVQGREVLLGELKMEVNSTQLKDVNIVEQQVRVTQKGDTTEYNAGAYKTNPDATAEDLIKKMPGITSENGTVKAQGEEVKKVLVDGKEFFGDDANLALKNLPAEVVDKVQVFDRMSDQANFTRFDDGNSQKALNIVTKKGKNNGVFGKVYGGYGYLTDHRYSAGALVNWFKDDMRLTVMGMSNNVNIQNFSTEDLLGVTGSNGSRRGGGGPGGGGGRWGNSPINNFLVGQQNGISNTHSAGVNYSDNWGKKVKVTGSYFFNLGTTNNTAEITRRYFNRGDSSSVYNENATTYSRNLNHRINMRMEYNIDSSNSIIFTPRFSWQQNQRDNNLKGNTTASDAFLSSTGSRTYTNRYGYNFSGDLLYQHKFKAEGRTISFNVSGSANRRLGDGSQQSENAFSDTDSTLLDQQSNTNNSTYSTSGNITYTEPIAQVGILQFSYQPSLTRNISDINTGNYDTLNNNYNNTDTLLSSRYNFDYVTHRAGVTYRIRTEKINAMIGINLQYAELNGQQQFPFTANTRKNFKDALPIAMFNYKFSNTSNLRIFYRAATNAPGITQLQSVIDNSNPLLLSSGNPDLKQNYSHFLMVRYGLTNAKTAHSFFVFSSVNYTQNYIANATIIAERDTLLNGDVLLRAGSQYTRPVNLQQGNLTANAFLTYGLPVKKLKSNLNLNAGFNYARTPGLINNSTNLSNTYSINGGATLSSNISEKIDFTISYTANYNIVRNSLQTNSNNNYFFHNASAKFNWNFWKGFVINTSVQNVLYTGIAEGFNQNYFLWNAELAYKFLKDKSLELKVGVYDILNQNNGIARNVTETYVEDSRNTVLRRYMLVTLTYNLRYFNKGKGNAAPARP